MKPVDDAVQALRAAVLGAQNGAVYLSAAAGSDSAPVLQALVEELGSRYPVAFLRRPTLPPGGLWMEVAARLDLESGYDAKRRILRLGTELSEQGRGLLIVVDGADQLPPETLYGLLGVARGERGVHVVLGWPEEAAAPNVLGDLQEVRLGKHTRSRVALPEPPVAPLDPPPPRATAALPAGVSGRRRRGAGLERMAWAVCGLAVGFVLGAILGSGTWPLLAPEGVGERVAVASPPDASPVYAPASKPAQLFEARAAPRAEPTRVETSRMETPPTGPPTRPDPSRAVEPVPAVPEVAARIEAAVEHPAGAPAPEVASSPPPASPPAARAPEAPPSEPLDRAPPSDSVPLSEPARPPPAEVTRRPSEPRRGPLAQGRLHVRSESPVSIEVDGRPFGPAPLEGVALSRGEHRVIAHYADGGVALKTVYLDHSDVSVSFR